MVYFNRTTNNNMYFIFDILVISSMLIIVSEQNSNIRIRRLTLGLQTCTESFDIRTDKIIRTEDSRAMGARYLNEIDVNERDECLKTCCETESCDVFVFEQRSPGSCYLFHCGSPEDFKCKFSPHGNYTSAVLTFNTHLKELENQIKLTKHEKELSRLRTPETPAETTVQPHLIPTVKVPQATNSADNKTSTHKSECSRYQFECKRSKECIAIYNACDGVPQCADGSDEEEELGCPSGTSQVKPVQTEANKYSPPVTNPDHKTQVTHKEMVQFGGLGAQQIPQQLSWPQQQAYSYQQFVPPTVNEKAPELSITQPKQEPVQQLSQQARFYGREGEGLSQSYPNLQNPGVPWQGYQQPVHITDEASHIFNHKGNGLVSDVAESPPQPTHNDRWPAGPAGNGYYNGANVPFFYPNAWNQPRHGVDDYNQQRSFNGQYFNPGQNPSDYYYEDPSRSRNGAAQGRNDGDTVMDLSPFKQFPKQDKAGDNKQETVESSLPKIKDEPPKNTESVKKLLKSDEGHKSSTVSDDKLTTTVKPTDNSKPDHKLKTHHSKNEELTMNEDDFVTKEKVEAKVDKPSGAILSLTFGMCISAIMLFIVGCRLRVVRRRMRHNGKSPYAHDADYLVNGMYL